MPDGGPAFPNLGVQEGEDTSRRCYGMSLHDYACIRLKVPETGKDWLDTLILKSLRTEQAGMALQGLCSSQRELNGERNPNQHTVAKFAYVFADAMLKEREGSHA